MENLFQEKLRTKFVGKRTIHYVSMTSTTEIAKKPALERAEDGSLTKVTAGEVTILKD